MRIVFTGDKGGVGKSTLAVLLAEWLTYHGTGIEIIDADPNQTAQTWLSKCAALGYVVSTPGAAHVIVDTAGTSGASLAHIRQATHIVAPFQAHVADLEAIVGWFLSLHPTLQQRVTFIPNRLATPQPTREQRDGLGQLWQVLEETGTGRLLPGLANRPAVYPRLLNGSSCNWFASLPDIRAEKELNEVFKRLLEDS